MADSVWGQGGIVLIHLSMGIGLAACAGLRAFLPLFVVALAGKLEFLTLSDSFSWLAGWPALIVFGAAVVAEVLSDKFPIVDNLLDSVQIFVKVDRFPHHIGRAGTIGPHQPQHHRLELTQRLGRNS